MAAEKKITVRLLFAQRIDDFVYPANQVVTLPEKQGKAMVKAGDADDSDEAVQYALSLPGAQAVEIGLTAVEEKAS